MKKKRNMGIVLCLLVCAVCVGCANKSKDTAKNDSLQEQAEGNLFAMNTYMTFQIHGSQAQTALSEMEQMIQNLEELWSVTKENSDIYRINHDAGKTVAVHEETAGLISFALDMAEQTEGVIDPTIYPVLTEWGFTTNHKHVPDKNKILELLTAVDYKKVELEGNTVKVPEGVSLDMGAFGKGYTADLATEKLKEYGIESALLSLGGNIQAVGSKPDGSDWKIGIQSPDGEGTIGMMEISDCAVVTSGAYENNFTDEDGNVYGHILSTETGYPADTDLDSVTVVSAEGKLCDALSTALFIMGTEDAEKYWRLHGGFEMLLVTKKQKILVTKALAEKFSVQDGQEELVEILE